MSREQLHERLENWARVYGCGGFGSVGCSPGFELYRTPDHYTERSAKYVVDYRDAELVQSAWLKLEARDRVLIGEWWLKRTRPEVVTRKANRVGRPTIITMNTLAHYIRWAENRLSQHLACCTKIHYDAVTT